MSTKPLWSKINKLHSLEICEMENWLLDPVNYTKDDKMSIEKVYAYFDQDHYYHQKNLLTNYLRLSENMSTNISLQRMKIKKTI